MNFLFQLDKIKELGFNIEVKRPPHYDGWECAITFNGKDVSTELNQDLCLFLEEFKDKRNEVKDAIACGFTNHPRFSSFSR